MSVVDGDGHTGYLSLVYITSSMLLSNLDWRTLYSFPHQITINVLDVNERPEFIDDNCRDMNIDENTVTSLCVVQAVDFDEEFNVITYSIENDHDGS